MRWFLRILGGLGILLVVLVVAVLALIDSAFVRGWITDVANAQLASDDGSGVVISDLGPGLPGALHVGHVAFLDAEGVWLEVDAVTLDWNPWALLGGNVDIDLVSVEQVAMNRAPVPGETEASSEEAASDQLLPQPPGFGVRVGALKIAEIAIEEDVAGQTLGFGVVGHADLTESGSGALNLQVTQTHGGTGHLVLDGSFDLARDRVSLTLDASQEAGGLLVTMAGIAGAPALEIKASLEGAASDFSGSLVARAGEGLSTDLTLAGSMSAEQIAMTVRGTADAGSFLDETTRPLVGEKITLDLDVVMAGDRLTVRQADMGVVTAQVSLSGTVDLVSESLNLTVTAENRDLAPILAMAGDVTFSSWRTELALTGTMTKPVAALNAVLADPSAGELGAASVVAQARVTPDDAAGGWQVALDTRLAGITSGNPALDGLLGDQPGITMVIRADQAFEHVTLENATVQAAAGQINARGTLTTPDGNVELTALTGRVNLAALSDIAGMPLTGQLDLRAAGRTTGWSETVEAVVSLSGREFGADDPVGALLGDTPEISARLSGTGETWTIADLSLATPLWQALGEAVIELSQGTVSARLSGPITIQGELAQALDPSLAASGTLMIEARGTLDAPGVNARLDLAQARYGEVDLAGLRFTVRELTLADGLATTVGASLPRDSEELAFTADLSADPAFTGITASRVTLRGLKVDLAGDLTVPLDGRPMEGNLAGGIGDLGPLARLAGLDVTGAGVVDVALRAGSGGNQDVSLNMAALDIGMDGASVADFRLALDALDVMNTPRVSARMSADGVVAGGQVIGRIIAGADGSLDNLSVMLQAKAAAWTLDSSLTGDLSQSVSLEFDKLSGTIGEEEFHLTRNFNFNMEGETLGVEGLSLDFAGGNISLSARAGDRSLAGEGQIAGVPVASLGPLQEALDLKGVIDGNFNLKADRSGATAHLALKVAGIGSHADPDGDVADLNFNADWDGKAIDGKVEIEGVDGLTARLAVSWPLTHYPADGTVLVTENDPFKAGLTIQGGLAELWDRLPLGDQTLSGDLDIAIEASGTLANPRIDGSARVVDARYENLTAGTLIEKLNLTTSIDGDGSLALQANGSDGESGTLSIKGNTSFSKDGGLDIDATLSLQDFRVVNLDNADVVAAGSVSYVGTLLGGTIKGDITADPVNINVAQSLPPSVTELHAQDVFEGKGAEQTSRSGSVWSSDLDLTVSFPRRFRVFGRGIESEWAGKLEITGTTSAPQVNGEINLVRGVLDVAGNEFTLTQGNVTIRPEDNFDPSFVIEAEAQAGDVLGQLRVSGHVSNPQLNISSVPPLPEDEVLARTLFGKSASSLSGLEAVQLASALAGLTGTATGGSGILDRTRAALGVDVLRVDTDDDGNARVGAGSYVAEGVYVGVEQGTGADSSAVEVEIDVTDNITVTTEAGANASARAGVEWRWDY